jgi:hypothetical protein
MTGKQAMAEGDGPGVRAGRAHQRPMNLFLLGNFAINGGFAAAVFKFAHKPTPDGVFLPPELAVIGALLIPLLWIATMAFIVPRMDEFVRRNVIDAYAGGFVVSSIGCLSWLLLSKGGVVPPPSALALFFAGAIGVAVSLAWLMRRRS